MANPAASAAALWVGLLILLMLVLSMLVVRQRRLHQVVFGQGEAPSLARAIRAFGNAAEYVPAGCAGLAMLALVQTSPLLIHLAGLALLAGRAVHAVGLSNNEGLGLPRSIGMSLTWLAYVFIGVTLVFYSF
ncbi:MAG: glutathione S-transferase [Caulobacteraceae bacterium]|nr:glutathione S-transferase [Caulobacteraceae bacterium]